MVTPGMSGWLRLESRLSEPAAEPWGLTEMWIEDPNGVRIVLVEVTADHPLAATRGRRTSMTATRRPRNSVFDGKCSGPASALSAAIEDVHLKRGDA